MDTIERNPREFIGANAPPLGELLPVETKDLASRFADLQSRLNWPEITTAEQADGATQVVVDLRALWHEFEELRVERKRPFFEACKTIDAFFAAYLDPLAQAGKRITTMVDLCRRRLQQAADTERRRLEDEARNRERTAALIDANAARAPMVKGAPAEEVADRHRGRAEELRTQAALTEARPIGSASGAKAIVQTEWQFEVEDWDALLKHVRAANAAIIEEPVRKFVAAQLRAKVRAIPGCRIFEDTKTVIRR
jgi:hypothetical protein